MPHAIRQDDVAIDYTVIVRAEVLGFQVIVHLEHNAGKTTGPDVFGQMVHDLEFLCSECDMVSRDLKTAEKKILIKVQGVYRDREVPPGKQRCKVSLNKRRRRPGDNQLHIPAIVQCLDMPLPARDALDLVKDQVKFIISADIGPVYGQNFGKGIIKRVKVRLIEIDKENSFCRNPLIPDEVIDGLVEKRGLSGTPYSGDNNYLSGSCLVLYL